MKCFVPARAFRKRLAAVAAVVPRQSPKPILQTVRLEVDAQGKGTLVATDLETWVRAGLPALRATRPGVVQVPPRALATILDESGTGEVELDADPDAFALVCREAELPCRLVVTGPQSRSTLSTFRPEEFPAREEPPSHGHHAIERHHLAARSGGPLSPSTRPARGISWAAAGSASAKSQSIWSPPTVADSPTPGLAASGWSGHRPRPPVTPRPTPAVPWPRWWVPGRSEFSSDCSTR
jgi:hypothetical protein